MKRIVVSIGLFLLTCLCGCATNRVIPTEDIWDPIEPVNRRIFWFNDKFDIYVSEPVARGYNRVLPERARLGVTNFFRNLRGPVDIANALLQAKVEQAFSQTGRFLVNTTAGIGGVMDIASDIGIERKTEDFGITLAHWGVPPGPYIVIPILGPSNLRDTVGLVGDGFADPIFYLEYMDTGLTYWERFAIEAGLKTVDFVNKRSRMMDAVNSAREAAFDYYYTMQGAYYQLRRSDFYGGKPPDEEGLEEGTPSIIMGSQ